MSCSRQAGRAGSYSIRPASRGGAVTMICRPSNSPAARRGDHPVTAHLDPADRRRQPHDVAEPVGEAISDKRGPADEAVLLCAAAGIDQPLERAGGVRVEQHMQHRQVAGLGGEDRLGPERQQHPRALARGVAADPGAERLAVHLPGISRRPGGIKRHLPRHRLQPSLRLADVGKHQGVDPRDGAGVGAPLAVEVQDLLPGVVRGEGRHREFRRKRVQPVLGRPGPLAAHLDDLAVADVLADHPAAYPVPGFEHQHRAPGARQLAGSRQARQAGTDDQHISCLGHARHLQLRPSRQHRVRGP